MRWRIVTGKQMIETDNMEGHEDSFEMSGERVSGIINYRVEDSQLLIERNLVFPSFRIQPNDTFGCYKTEKVEFPELLGSEIFDRVRIGGVLTFDSHTDSAVITRTFYPSTALACFYEDITVRAKRGAVTPIYELQTRLDTKLGCQGYFYLERVADKPTICVAKGETFRVIFAYKAYFANQEPPFESNALEKRLQRTQELLSQCDLTTGDEAIDTAFAFAKIRAGESLFATGNGLIHSPGGFCYYAAVWCNDQLEYAAPWFAFTGDKKATEACENAFRWYEPYMNDKYLPIPSSIIAEGYDYWNGAGDRGDAAMVLFGLARFLLTVGRKPDVGQQKALEWCCEYIERKILEDGAVFSDTDELEGRLSSGVNLSTTSLAYGGLRLVSALWNKYGEKELCNKAEQLRNRIEKAFEGHFAAELAGYQTYAYHKGCKEIRAWNCLPIYMGIDMRAEDTLASIEDKLWCDFGCKTTEGENTAWDRSTLYFLMSLFRAGKTERAFSMLKAYAENRLLGERVPYPVEAYPEGNRRQLSAESALFCRVITDGLFDIVCEGDGFSYRQSLPFLSDTVSLKNILIRGEYRNLDIHPSSIRE